MKNITVSVDDETYHKARVIAAERRTSVSAIVRDTLRALADEESEFERTLSLERKIVQEIRGRSTHFSASDRLSRTGAHDRDAFR